jgi:hypothetical protein
MTNGDKQLGSFAKLMHISGGAKKTEPLQEPPPVENPELDLTSHIESHIACNIAFLQSDIEDLREPAYMAQTYRLREGDIDWVKDIAHSLSKDMKRRKVSQTDIVRISFKLFEKVLASDRAFIQMLLEKIK